MALPYQLAIGDDVSFNGELCRVVEFYLPRRNMARKYVLENLRTGCRRSVFKHEIDFNDSDDDMLLSVPEITPALNVPEPTLPPKNESRFGNVDEDRLQQLAESRNEKSTENSTKWALKIFRDWLESNSFPLEFEMRPAVEINTILRRFYAEVRTQNGKEYSKSALMSIRAAINRHLTSPPFVRQLNLMHDKEFMSSNHVFVGLVKEMKRAGKDVTRHHDPISHGDLESLYTSGILSIDSPLSLVRKVWFEVTLHFGRRGIEGLRSLRGDSFVFSKDDTGAEYYQMAYNEADKTHHGVDSREQSKKPRMYETGDNHCPVQSMKLYMSKRNQSNSAFFQRPLVQPKSDVWYAQSAMGECTLKKMMATISAAAGLSKIYTNHCVRATTATKLSEAGVGALGIMSVTGHRNEQSLKSYITTPSVAQRRAFSNILQGNTAINALSPPCLSSDHAVSRQVTAPRSICDVASCQSSPTSSVSYSSSNSVSTPFHGVQLLQSANISGGTITFNFYDSSKK